MDKKLAEYRKRKEREIYIQQLRQKFHSLFIGIFERVKRKEPVVVEMSEDTEKLIDIEPESITELEEVPKKCTLIDYVYYLLWFTLWITCYIIFIQLQFGLVYLILSGFVGMYLNTRTTPRKPNEASAYSVFNKNCESIDGALKAEQFEKELLYGAHKAS